MFILSSIFFFDIDATKIFAQITQLDHADINNRCKINCINSVFTYKNLHVYNDAEIISAFVNHFNIVYISDLNSNSEG